MTIAAPQAFRWTRDMYDRMVDEGILGPHTRVQLIDGEVIEMLPQGSRHAGVVQLVGEALRKGCPEDAHVRFQLPLALDDHSEPEPELGVVPGVPRDYIKAHPATALLVVEVAESSLGLDRTRKHRIYACNTIPEYWIVNLAEVALEVHRSPRGEAYEERRELKAGATIAPLAWEGAPVAVADLLP
ncbi:MAG: Uma2 family endonuclease [Gammaproteobacteria bacterium]|nr:Uma2 family endonuclease [Gammaproteobacteria bacterium]